MDVIFMYAQIRTYSTSFTRLRGGFTEMVSHKKFIIMSYILSSAEFFSFSAIIKKIPSSGIKEINIKSELRKTSSSFPMHL